MDLYTDLQEQIRAYLAGRSTLVELRDWLADHAQAIVDSGHRELDELDGLVWVLVSELDYGHRDEADVRRELAAATRAPIFRMGEPDLQGGIDTGVRTIFGLSLRADFTPPSTTVHRGFVAAPS